MAIARVRRKPPVEPAAAERAAAYVLEDQVGFLLRCAHQRASEDFNAVMGRFSVTPTQFAALAKRRRQTRRWIEHRDHRRDA